MKRSGEDRYTLAFNDWPTFETGNLVNPRITSSRTYLTLDSIRSNYFKKTHSLSSKRYALEVIILLQNYFHVALDPDFGPDDSRKRKHIYHLASILNSHHPQRSRASALNPNEQNAIRHCLRHAIPRIGFIVRFLGHYLIEMTEDKGVRAQ
ncbi:hypothetical protein EVAR_12020_1 [Eumeta japonica]|uniref:Uncharacterized protein n=1 Tax=Eumeta variegata TaxID=151549 RepID=A0A4C1U538_EUMVA|nr:hypothetical protein EVAR_12020_1 [Eumeta japonica]